MYNEATTPQDLSSNPYFNYTTATLHVPAGTKATYEGDNKWKKFKEIVELPIKFADDNVKALCIANWDTNGDGEFDAKEAAAVTSLENVFKNKSITSFNELKYFTGLTSVGYEAFEGCSGLTSITIPNSVTSIGSGAFWACSSLTSITMGNGVTSIGVSAFSVCTSLTSIDIPNSVTNIGSTVFFGCSGLTSITIPNSVTSIGSNAFYGCTGLNDVYNEATTPQDLSSNPYFNYTTATLHVPAGTKELYQAADYWKNFTNIVEMSIEPIVDETVIEFDDKDYIVDNTPVDLNNTVINDMYISMDNKSDVNNPDGFYDSTDKCIVINKATSASAIETAVASDLGSSDFINNYTGIVIEVNG